MKMMTFIRSRLLQRSCSLTTTTTTTTTRMAPLYPRRAFSSTIISSIKSSPLFRERGYINGVWSESLSGQHFEVTDPATGAVIGHVPDMDQNDTRLAIESANNAFLQWKTKTGKDRADVLNKWYNQILHHKDLLASLLTLENGKPLAESIGEVMYAASFVQWSAEEAKRLYGDIIPTTQSGKRYLAMKFPVGVSGLITPWNFPYAMVTRKAAPAIAAGCTTVLKPAEDTPLTALALAYLAELSGLPPGVFNVITASRNNATIVGKELTSNPLVKKISFTGSTRVGKWLLRESADTVKRVSMELGGNAPFIVFDDADLDSAVKGCIVSKFRNTGQTCVCPNRIYVQDSVYDTFVSKLHHAVEKLVPGNPFDKDVNQGPLINENALKKIVHHLNDAQSKGATIVTGGKQAMIHNINGTGLFFEPTIVTGITRDMVISQEEIFGPVASIYRFKTEEEIIRIANDTPYGLSGYFYSRDISRIFRVVEALEVGMIGVNESLISNEATPFGGMKESGLGREGGKYGVEAYLDMKYVCIGVKESL